MATNESEFAVHLTSPSGKPFVLLPGAEIPSWAEITNPYVLGIDPDADDDSGDDSGDDGTGGPPPKSGKGGGVRAWRAYAAANGVDGEGAEVDEIIAALEAAGVPVE